MLTTKRQAKLRAKFMRHAESLGLPNIKELGDSLRRSGVTNIQLIFISEEITMEDKDLTVLEAVAAEFPDTEDDSAAIKSLCVRAGACGFTQSQLASLVGVSPVSLSRWCSGVHAPSKRNLEIIQSTVAKLEAVKNA